jgi:SAM-dependent methyltransferase
MRGGEGLRTVDGVRDNHTQPKSAPASVAWASMFAAVYDPFLWIGERTGLRAARRELLAQARGCTVEIGAGTGLNLPYYPDDIDDLAVTEPDAALRARLATTLDRSGRRARVVDAPAERLPFEDGSVDTVVSTFVLCTVDAPDRALREIGRVLRPDGQLLFIEHVRSESPTVAAWQDRLVRPWRRFARGCRCNRATAPLMVACGLELEQVRTASWHAMPPIVRPLIAGRARLATAPAEHYSGVAERARSASTEGVVR